MQRSVEEVLGDQNSTCLQGRTQIIDAIAKRALSMPHGVIHKWASPKELEKTII